MTDDEVLARRPRVSLVLAASLAALVVSLAPSVAAAEGLDLGALEADEAEAEPGETEERQGGETAEAEVVDELAAGSGVRVSTICTNCNAARLMVNGMQGEHVEVTFDGIPSAGGLDTIYRLVQYPSQLVGYTGVKRGPGSVLTGSAGLAGSVELHSPKLDRTRGVVDLEVGSWGWRTVRAGGTARWGPVGALGFVQGATQAEVDANGDGFNEVADFQRYTGEAILSFDLTDFQVLTVRSSYYDEEQVDGPGGPYRSVDRPWLDPPYFYVDEDAFFNWRTNGLSWALEKPSGLAIRFDGRYSKRNQSQWSVTAAPLVGEEQRDEDQRRTFDVFDARTDLELTVERPVGLAGYLTGGVGWSLQRLRVDQSPERLQPFWILDTMEQRELFVQYDRSAGARWDWSVGLRWDDFSVGGKVVQDLFGGPGIEHLKDEDRERSFLSPRAQLHFRPNAKVILGLAAGRGIVGPRPAFAETCCGAKYQRNLDLPPERAWSHQAQVEWHPNPDSRLTFTAFWTDFSDYHERIVYKTTSYIPYYSVVAIQEARIRGLDVVHDMRFVGDRYNVGWTYTWNDADGTYAFDDGTASWKVQGLRYVPEHAASAYLRYANPERGTTISLTLTHTGSMQHFLLEQSRREDEPWEFLDSDDYTTVDVSFEQRIGTAGWSVTGGVQNLTDYFMPDLGNVDSAYDWGPITGRFFHVGMRWVR